MFFPLSIHFSLLGRLLNLKKGTKELKCLDFILAYVILKAYLLVSKKKFTKIREL